MAKKKQEQQCRWPTDERFRKFAAMVADAVQRELKRGERLIVAVDIDPVWAWRDTVCPLGTLDNKQLKELGQLYHSDGYPSFLNDSPGGAFTRGFDGEPGPRSTSKLYPYFELGREYRKRFAHHARKVSR